MVLSLPLSAHQSEVRLCPSPAPVDRPVSRLPLWVTAFMVTGAT